MVLHMVGLGLFDQHDITVRGLETVKKCSKVFLEAYTSILLCDKTALEELYGKEVVVADRQVVESESDSILDAAVHEDVAFLVVGDPFGATTHTDLWLRAKQRGIEVHVVHNASVMNAVGACGLQLYRFGEAVSIVFFTPTWRPDSFYDKIACNRRAGLHTLCLLDIKVKEPNLEAMCRGKTIYDPPSYMSVNQAVEQLLEIESKRGQGAYSPDTICVGIARLGSQDQQIVCGPMESLKDVDFGKPLHCLVISGDLQPFELEVLELFGLSRQ